jgi:hypothetical protein
MATIPGPYAYEDAATGTRYTLNLDLITFVKWKSGDNFLTVFFSHDHYVKLTCEDSNRAGQLYNELSGRST